MKFKILLLILCVFALQILWANDNYPKPTSWVNDYTNTLSQESIQQLEALITELKQKTEAEIAVAIVNDMGGLDRDTYANELYRSWKVGSKNDEGILYFIAKTERKVKIEVGYGLEGLFNDAKAGRILDEYSVPYLKLNQYDQAVVQTVAVIAQIIAEDKGVTLTGSPVISRKQAPKKNTFGNLLYIIVFIFLVIITRGRIIIWMLMFAGSGGRGGFGGGGSGGGFGGFGGFGGGSSGGGGAGRSF